MPATISAKSASITHRGARLALIVIIAVNVALTTASSFTRIPWWDEGIIVSPAYNLAYHGFLGTTVQHGRGLPVTAEFPGYDRYTYWALPVYILTLAGWVRVFGASIIATRALSVFCGGVLVLAWYIVARRLTGSRLAGLFAAGFVSIDLSVITAASTTRMDSMTAALGACGAAAYVSLRRRDIRWALLAANTFAAAALLTHPTGFVPVLALLVLVLYQDWRLLRWSVVPWIAVPYVLFLSGWGLYVLRAPDVALKQLQAQAGHRVGGVVIPWKSLQNDFILRYWQYFYSAKQGIDKLKVLILLEYILGVFALVAIPALRRHRGVRTLALMAGAAYCALAIVDGVKSPHYMLLTCTLFAALSGIAAVWAFETRPAGALAAIALLLAVQIGGSLQRVRADAFHRKYTPAIEFLKANKAGYPAPIIGPSELWFGLGPDAVLLDDMRIGYYSGWRPRWIVTNTFYDGALEGYRQREPAVWQHIQSVLQRFDQVFSNDALKIYRERQSSSDIDPPESP